MPRHAPEMHDTEPTLVTAEILRGWPLPDPAGGKNVRGSILVIGGSVETLGAVLLAAEAALRAGAGKLQVANASLTRYERDADGGFRLIAFNEVEHIVAEAEDVTEEPDAAQPA